MRDKPTRPQFSPAVHTAQSEESSELKEKGLENHAEKGVDKHHVTNFITFFKTLELDFAIHKTRKASLFLRSLLLLRFLRVSDIRIELHKEDFYLPNLGLQ